MVVRRRGRHAVRHAEGAVAVAVVPAIVVLRARPEVAQAHRAAIAALPEVAALAPALALGRADERRVERHERRVGHVGRVGPLDAHAAHTALTRRAVRVVEAAGGDAPLAVTTGERKRGEAGGEEQGDARRTAWVLHGIQDATARDSAA